MDGRSNPAVSIFWAEILAAQAQGTGSTVPIGTLDLHDATRRRLIQPPLAIPYFRTASTEYLEQVGV
jgi:hypothetical protein